MHIASTAGTLSTPPADFAEERGRVFARLGRRGRPTSSGPPVDVNAGVDRSVLLAFRDGDPDAVRAMYREYGRLVYAVAYRVLGRPDLAEDATQQTFVRAWQAADRFDVDRNPASWLATIAKRVAIDIHRREARRPTSAIDMVAADDPALVTLPPGIETLDAVWHVRRAIDELPTDEATIMRMQHLDGMTHREISDGLGIALGTVKSRSRRAHQRLAVVLGHLREPVT